MSPQSPIDQDIKGDGEQLRTSTSIYPITEEGDQDDSQQPEHNTDDPSIRRPDTSTAGQRPEVTDSTPCESTEPPSPANASSTTPTSGTSTNSPLGRPPPSSKHYYLEEMWPGQPICHLCRKEYEKTNRAIRALPCGDIFHRACIDHLLGQKDGRCPSCESPIPPEWYMPHKFDPSRPAGSPCLCHPASKARTTTEPNTKNGGPSFTSPGVLAIRKVYQRIKEIMVRCAPGRKPEKVYASYKTESGQTRYIEGETGVGLPGPGSGYADGDLQYQE